MAACIACSGALRETRELGFPVQVCVACGGLHGRVDRLAAQTLVGWGLPMQGAPSTSVRYFDLDLVDPFVPAARVDRAHGWYDWQTRRVVQEG